MQISKLLGPVAVAAAALWSPYASAVFISNNDFVGQGVFIGTLDPGQNDSAAIAHGRFSPIPVPVGFFTEYWVFDIAPAGNISASATWQPSGGITGFNVKLYKAGTSVTNCTQPAAFNSANAVCTGWNAGGLGAQLPGFPSGSGNFAGWDTSLPFQAAGRYVMAISGTAAANSSYGGAIAVNAIPEPGSLALAGLALLGAAVTLRKRKSV